MQFRNRLALLLLPLTACSHQTFKQTFEEPIYRSKAVSALPGEMVEAEAGTFMWESCKSAGDAALRLLRERQVEKGFDSLANLEWYDYRKESWRSVPTCKTEYGWLFGYIYTVWYTTATVVRVRGFAFDRSPGVKALALASVGKDPVESDTAARRERGQAFGYGGLGAFVFLPRAELGAGWWLSPTTSFAFHADAWAFFSDPPLHDAGIHLLSGGALGGEWRHFLGDSFNVAAGPAIESRHYVEFAGNGPAAPISGSKVGDWQEYGLAVQVAVGNDVRLRHGFTVGCDWVGATFPVAHLRSVGGAPSPGSRRYGREVVPELLVFRLSKDF